MSAVSDFIYCANGVLFLLISDLQPRGVLKNVLMAYNHIHLNEGYSNSMSVCKTLNAFYEWTFLGKTLAV